MNNKKTTKEKLIGWVILLLYTALYIWVTYYHEPWFDEAQAWEIAKCGSYRDLLFLIPHGEGHPPLWSLILSIPAKLGVPYEIGIKSVAYIFSIATVYLIVFKAPFTKWVRYTLPFTYFFFYQYGVISRTYCVAMFIIILLAVRFKTKDTQPYKYMVLLALLCACSAYGIVIAGGISICWCIDIFLEKKNKDIISTSKELLSDKRVRALLILLVIAILLIIEILPYSTTVAANSSRYDNFAKKLVYMFLAMLGDALISPTFPEIWENAGAIDFVPGMIATVMAWVYLCVFSAKKTWKYYFVPQILFAVLMTYYGYQHHSGICVIIYVAALWISYDSEHRTERLRTIRERLSKDMSGLLTKLFKIIPAVTVGIMLLFSIMSVRKDIMLPYSDGRAVSEFIKEHHMENALIMAEWDVNQQTRSAEDDDERAYTMEDYDTNFVGSAVSIVPYFDKNIFFNHNDSFNNVGYVTHFAASVEENYAAYSRWKEYGYPEVLVGEPHIEFVYGDRISYSDYKLVFTIADYPIWKGTTAYYVTRVYVRNDCLGKFGLD